MNDRILSDNEERLSTIDYRLRPQKDAIANAGEVEVPFKQETNNNGDDYAYDWTLSSPTKYM